MHGKIYNHLLIDILEAWTQITLFGSYLLRLVLAGHGVAQLQVRRERHRLLHGEREP